MAIVEDKDICLVLIFLTLLYINSAISKSSIQLLNLKLTKALRYTFIVLF